MSNDEYPSALRYRRGDGKKVKQKSKFFVYDRYSIENRKYPSRPTA